LDLTILIVLTTGLVLGALVGWLAARPTQARLQTELEKDRAVHAEKLKAYQAAEATLRDAFQSISHQALESNNRSFLALAETRLQQARHEASSDLESRKKEIEHLLEPLQKTLDHVDREIRDAERRRAESGTQLLERIASLDTIGQNLRAETARLVDALKRPGVRGRWGELQLKRVVELAGLTERCDFDEQRTYTASGSAESDGEKDRRLRPDVIVRLPGGKHVVIDAKVPLDAYLKALEAPDEATRQTLLADHARQVRVHLPVPISW
jgi:DNA recombination protein RmuC